MAQCEFFFQTNKHTLENHKAQYYQAKKYINKCSTDEDERSHGKKEMSHKLFLYNSSFFQCEKQSYKVQL